MKYSTERLPRATPTSNPWSCFLAMARKRNALNSNSPVQGIYRSVFGPWLERQIDNPIKSGKTTSVKSLIKLSLIQNLKIISTKNKKHGNSSNNSGNSLPKQKNKKAKNQQRRQQQRKQKNNNIIIYQQQ